MLPVWLHIFQWPWAETFRFLFWSLREGSARLRRCSFYCHLDSPFMVKNSEITWIHVSWQSFSSKLNWIGWSYLINKILKPQNISFWWTETITHKALREKKFEHATELTRSFPLPLFLDKCAQDISSTFVCMWISIHCPSLIQWHVIVIKHFPKSCHQLIFQWSTISYTVKNLGIFYKLSALT